MSFAFYRMTNARVKAEGAEVAAEKARQDSNLARVKAKEYAPEFYQPGKGNSTGMTFLRYPLVLDHVQ